MKRKNIMVFPPYIYLAIMVWGLPQSKYPHDLQAQTLDFQCSIIIMMAVGILMGGYCWWLWQEDREEDFILQVGFLVMGYILGWYGVPIYIFLWIPDHPDCPLHPMYVPYVCFLSAYCLVFELLWVFPKIFPWFEKIIIARQSPSL